MIAKTTDSASTSKIQTYQENSRRHGHMGREMLVANIVMGTAALLLVGAAYLKSPAKLISEAANLSMTLLMLLPIVMLGLVLAALLAVLAMKSFIKNWLQSDSALKNISVSLVGGILLPGEPLIGMPMVLAVKETGAKDEDLVMFVTAWKLLSASRWPELTAFLGPTILGVYLASSLLMVLLQGIITRIMPQTILKRSVSQ